MHKIWIHRYKKTEKKLAKYKTILMDKIKSKKPQIVTTMKHYNN